MYTEESRPAFTGSKAVATSKGRNHCTSKNHEIKFKDFWSHNKYNHTYKTENILNEVSLRHSSFYLT